MNIKYLMVRNYQDKRIITSHSHDFYEFVYYISGSGETKIGTKKYFFKEGSYAFLEPGVNHSEKHYGVSRVFIVGLYLDDFNPIPTTYFKEEDNPSILENVNNLLKENKNKNAYYDKLFVAYVETILALLLREQTTNHPSIKNKNMERAISYIDEYFFTEIDLNKIAADAGYCTDRFRNIFKSIVGVTPKKYILDKRLNYAKKLLIETNNSVEEISVSSGFSYYSRFSLFFKEQTGVSPTEYRKKHIATIQN